MALVTANQFDLTPEGQFAPALQTAREGTQRLAQGKQNLAIGEQSIVQNEQTLAGNRAKFIGDSVASLRALPFELRAQAMERLRPRLAEFGIDPSAFQGADLSDNSLDQTAASVGSLQAQPVAEPFKLGAGQTQFSGTGDVIASVAAKAEKPTSLQQNLIAAGLTPGTPEYQAALLKGINKPLVSIGGEQTFKKAVATGQAKTFGRIGEEADAAIDANQSLDVLDAIDVDTGALEPMKQGIAAFAKAFGIDSSRLANVAKGEAFNAEAQRIVLAVKASQKGPQTDKDEETIRKTVASLGNTKAGNQFIIDSARALNNRRIERKDFYDAFIQDADGSFRNEQGVTADRAWSEFKRKTPMISSTMRTPEGLPVFFYKFESDVRNANPDATREEIVEVWKQQNKRAR